MENNSSPCLNMSGWLKRKSSADQRWHRRFVELNDKILSLYKNETKNECEASIELTSESKVREVSDARLPRFTLYLPNSEITFTHESPQIILQWIAAIRNLAQLTNNLKMDDFDIISVIGRGSFGKVMMTQHKGTEKIYAVKTIQKKKLLDMKKCYTVIAERNILLKTRHPFIVQLCFAFQTTSKFYLGLEYAAGGEMFYHMDKRGSIPMNEVRLYAAEIALALGYMHSQGIVYRDLKPENLLLDQEGHIKITDFGLSKEIAMTESTATFCGTTDYLAPEIILRSHYGYAVDWWALGILIYEMIFQVTPFSANSNVKTYANILNNKPMFPKMVNLDLKDVVEMLLEKDPAKRAKLDDLKTAKFFSGIDWDKVYQKEYKPLFIPENRDLTKELNFDEEFTNETPVDSVVQPVSADIDGFSYMNPIFDNQRQMISS